MFSLFLYLKNYYCTSNEFILIPSAFDESATTTQGLENANGTRGVPVPGRNGQIFSAMNDAYRFTPYIPYTYNWNPGNLSGQNQTVTPMISGPYTVNISDGTSCVQTFSTTPITVNTNCLVFNLKIFIEGFYKQNSMMTPVMFNSGVSTDTTVCDTIIVELHDPLNPANIISTKTGVLHTNGKAEIVFPAGILNQSYYIVVHHRNSVETWSKNPVLFNNQVTSFDFTGN